ncbi:hypothetical protein ACWDXV_34085 [Nocardia nova]
MWPGLCPRCGGPVPENGRGRPRRWCSDRCRRRGAEEGIRIHTQVRERVVEREIHIPHNPVSAVDLVLRDVDAVELLLQRMIERLEIEPQTDLDWARQRELRSLADTVQRLTAALARPLKPQPSTLEAVESQSPRAQSTATQQPGPADTVTPPAESAPPQKDQRPKRRKNRHRPVHR